MEQFYKIKKDIDEVIDYYASRKIIWMKLLKNEITSKIICYLK